METTETNQPQTIKQTRSRTFNMKRELIKMEKDIPAPEDAFLDRSKSIYPVEHLEVNESFSFAYASNAKINMLKSVKTSIAAYVKLHPKKRFVARIIEGEGVIRVWRISDEPSNAAE